VEQERNDVAPEKDIEAGADHPAEPAVETDGGPGVESGREETVVAERVQKRTKRESRKELLEHLHKKSSQLMALDKEVKDVTQQLIKKEDRLLRLAAEFENYRKRTAREWELLQKRANADLIKEIMGGIDNFDRAFAVLGGTDEALQEGLKLIHAGLMDILKKAGVKEMEALGAKFDPQYHEAVGEIDGGDVGEGCVAQVVQKGYLLYDEMLRPARVMVARRKTS
jgi:molecular chaperone GrpE